MFILDVIMCILYVPESPEVHSRPGVSCLSKRRSCFGIPRLFGCLLLLFLAALFETAVVGSCLCLLRPAIRGSRRSRVRVPYVLVVSQTQTTPGPTLGPRGGINRVRRP